MPALLCVASAALSAFTSRLPELSSFSPAVFVDIVDMYMKHVNAERAEVIEKVHNHITDKHLLFDDFD